MDWPGRLPPRPRWPGLGLPREAGPAVHGCDRGFLPREGASSPRTDAGDPPLRPRRAHLPERGGQPGTAVGVYLPGRRGPLFRAGRETAFSRGGTGRAPPGPGDPAGPAGRRGDAPAVRRGRSGTEAGKKRGGGSPGSRPQTGPSACSGETPERAARQGIIGSASPGPGRGRGSSPAGRG